MTYDDLKPGSVLIPHRPEISVAWLVIGKNSEGNSVWVDLYSHDHGVSDGAGNMDLDLDFYELFEP